MKPRFRQYVVSFLFLAPALLPFLLFTLTPSVWAAGLTFIKGGMLARPHFTGLENWRWVLSDGIFWRTARNTIEYTALVIPIVLVVGIALAGLLHRPIRGSGFYRAAVFFPLLSSVVVASIAWQFIIHPDGPLNLVLTRLGLPSQNMLGNPNTAIPAIVLVEVWRGVGFYAMLFLAALQGLPLELHEAALLDGATRSIAFRHVTLPLLKPTILFATVMATIWNLQIFDSVFVLTQGGPAYATSTITWYVYMNAFRYERIGPAAVMAFMLLGLILVLAVVQMKWLRSDIEY